MHGVYHDSIIIQIKILKASIDTETSYQEGNLKIRLLIKISANQKTML